MVSTPVSRSRASTCPWALPPTSCSPLAFQFIDVDNFLTNPQTLSLMMAENRTIVAPMLESRGLYSNFWCGMTPQASLGSGAKAVWLLRLGLPWRGDQGQHSTEPAGSQQHPDPTGCCGTLSKGSGHGACAAMPPPSPLPGIVFFSSKRIT